MKNYDLAEYRQYTLKSEIDKALNTLEGILTGIAFDRKINELEIAELKNWCSINSQYRDKPPFYEFIPLIEQALEDGMLTKEEVDDLLWVSSNFGNQYFDAVTSDIQRLQGILHGILSDNDINEKEIKALSEWLDQNDYLQGLYPYEEIHSMVISVLRDGVIDDIEKANLRGFFGQFVDLQTSLTIDKNEINKLKKKMNINGICAVCPEITFENMSFCVTGASSKATRSKIKNIVEVFSGTFHNNVTQKTNYLVVGSNGNPCWAFSCYGRKVERAMELRRSGFGILIVHENDFWDAIEDLK